MDLRSARPRWWRGALVPWNRQHLSGLTVAEGNEFGACACTTA
jgi:hypothetical protein